mmetsp:Transcript_5201/g.7682  ORF Transcript_5201/g.7682 Transcript_5201/m.7682 type:complete len:717 (+) Transcript_5201:134-2284(+)
MGRFAYEEVEEDEQDEVLEEEEEDFKDATACSYSFDLGHDRRYGNEYDDTKSTNNSIVAFPLTVQHKDQHIQTPTAQCHQDTRYNVHDHNRNHHTSSSTSQTHDYDINRYHAQPQAYNHVDNDYYLSHYNRHDDHPSLEPHHRQHQRRSSIKQHCIIIVMLILLQRYTPPPPPPNESWNEFLSKSSESCVLMAQNLVMLVLYISFGCINNIYGDFKSRIRISTIFSSGDEEEYGHDTEHLCSIVVPMSSISATSGGSDRDGNGNNNNNGTNNSHGIKNDNNNYNNDHHDDSDADAGNDKVVAKLMSKIAAQDYPLRHIVETLRGWNNDREKILVDDTNKNQNHMNTHNRPLSMIFTGANGVGKYTTAMQLANTLLEECGSGDGDGDGEPSSSPLGLSDSVLILKGLDYALEEENSRQDNEDDKQSMDFSQGQIKNQNIIQIDPGIVQKILDHIYHRQGSATVIIIKHVENVSSKARSELTRLWNQSRVTFTSTSNKMKNNGYENRYRGWMTKDKEVIGQNGHLNSVELSLTNVAFICTTDLGVDKLFEVLLKSNGVHNVASYSDIKKATQQEISQYFDSFVFDIVTPFWPLRYWDMLRVIDQMIKSEAGGHKFKNIKVHESAARFFINPKSIEYFEFKLTEGSYLFSKNGANDMMDRVRNILDRIDEKIVASSFYSQDDIVLLEYDENRKDLLMKLCSQYGDNENLCSQEMRLVLV